MAQRFRLVDDLERRLLSRHPADDHKSGHTQGRGKACREPPPAERLGALTRQSRTESTCPAPDGSRNLHLSVRIKSSNDRLLLGLKGTMSEFELSLFRQRAREAFEQKIKRGCALWQRATPRLRR
jgi:hypothetical protein